MFEKNNIFKFRARSKFKKKFLKFYLVAFSAVALSISSLVIVQKFFQIDYLSSAQLNFSTAISSMIEKPIKFFDDIRCSLKTNSMLKNDVQILTEEIEKLKSINTSMKVQMIDEKNIKKIVESLNENFPSKHILRVLGSQNIFPHTYLYLKNIEDFSITKNQTIAFENCLIGRVLDFTKKKIKVLLITDFYSRVPAIIKETGDQVIIQGQGYDDLKVVFIDQSLSPPETLEGMIVVTSGIDDIFPANVPVAKIVSSKNGEVLARPFVNLNTLTFVQVQNN